MLVVSFELKAWQARVGLARGLMTPCDVVLLDDVLSAVDVHVATALVQDALLGALKDSTRVAGLRFKNCSGS